MILLRILLISLIFSVFAIPQSVRPRFNKKNFKSSFATAARQKIEKDRYFFELDQLFNGEYKDLNEKRFIRSFKELKLKFIKEPYVESFIKYVFTNQKLYSKNFLYEVLELAYTLFPSKFNEEVKEIFFNTDSQNLFAVSAQYLMKNNIKIDFSGEMEKRFEKKNDLLLGLEYQLKSRELKTPSLIDLLTHNFIKNKTIIFSFHRKERKYPGITVIRTPKGDFVKSKDGEFAGVRQLACSATNLPGYFKRGNTPQGIYSVQGYYITKTESIGPSPIVISRMPYEVSVSSFFHKRKTGKWTLEKYKSILPESWKNYFPFSESYRGGKTGRRLIIMHGSADDMSYYKDLSYYPLTPTLGCLTTMEKWDSETGVLLESDQINLMNNFYGSGKLNGFLIVVELDDQKSPVTMSELKDLLLKAEKILKIKY